jgi:RNA polymerase sigma factor (TIGR02999 family)
MSAGEAQALERLMPLVYDTLKPIAHRPLRSSQAPLCTTELVHEAYLKLAPAAPPLWQGRAHFYGVAARAMRQILIDLARHRRVVLRWQEGLHAAAGEPREPAESQLDLITLDRALDRLGTHNARLRMIVEFRYFAGMTEADIAHVLNVSTRTVERDWTKARLWLHQELFPRASAPPVEPTE